MDCLLRSPRIFLSALLLLSACAGQQAEVTVVIDPTQQSSVMSGLFPTSSFTNPRDDMYFDVSSTGLIKKFKDNESGDSLELCYAVHVRGDGLMKEQDSNPQSCQVHGIDMSVNGIGVLSPRAYPYGADASIVLKPGTNRSIDLVAIPNPDSEEDPNCTKPLQITQLSGEFVITYGNYIVPTHDNLDYEDLAEGTPYEATDLPLLHFAGRNGLTLSPGAQTISLTPRPWFIEEIDGEDEFIIPYPYGRACSFSSEGGGDDNGTTFPPLNPSSDGEDYIFTGMEANTFLEVECPSGVSELSMHLIGLETSGVAEEYVFENGGDAPQVDCLENEDGDMVGTFYNIPLGDPSLDWETVDCGEGQGECIDFAVSEGDNIDGDIVAEGRFYNSKRYQVSETAGEADLVWGDAGAPSSEFAGYEKSGNVRKLFVHQRALDSQGAAIEESKIYELSFVEPATNHTGAETFIASNTTYSDWMARWDQPVTSSVWVSALDTVFSLFDIPNGGNSDTVLSSTQLSTDSPSNKAILPPQTQGYQGLIASESGYLVTLAGYVDTDSASGLRPIGDGTINLAAHAMENWDQMYFYISSVSNNVGCSSVEANKVYVFENVNANNFKLVDPVTTLHITGPGDGTCEFNIENVNSFVFKPGSSSANGNLNPLFVPFDGGYSSPLKSLSVDLPVNTAVPVPGGETMQVQHLLYSDSSGVGYTRCESNLTECTTAQQSLTVLAADLFASGSTGRAIVVSGASTPEVMLYDLIDSGGAQMDQVDMNDDAIVDATDIASFYPALPFVDPNSIILKTLRNRDQSIESKKDALLYLEHSTGNVGDLYRTRDGGFTWFRVYSINTTTDSIADIEAVHLYTGSGYKPGFVLLKESSDGLRIVYEDGQHGF